MAQGSPQVDVIDGGHDVLDLPLGAPRGRTVRRQQANRPANRRDAQQYGQRQQEDDDLQVQCSRSKVSAEVRPVHRPR